MGAGGRRPGTLPLPAEVSPRPAWIVHRDDVPAKTEGATGPELCRARRLGAAAGSRTTGLRHVTIAPGTHGWPRHCHASEEELFVILGGSGTVRIGDEEAHVRAGHVLSRPAGTRLAHSFRAGPEGSSTSPTASATDNDIVYYPDSGKVSLAGVGVIGRIEPLDYWDGEDEPA